MPTQTLDRWRQSKVPVPSSFAAAERRARLVLILTLVTMLAELVTGYVTGSLALMADGWHMGSHAAALGITAFAYHYARRNAQNDRFSFGTGKVSALGGYSSALLLGVVAFLVGAESVERLIEPSPVDFADALIVAVVGLVINLTSAHLLAGGRQHDPARATDAHAGHGHHHHDPSHHGHHAHGHDLHVHGHHGHAHHGHDHNLRAAYLHVVADALTSVLAIGALLAGIGFGWVWLDPAVAFIASGVIAWWAWGLLRMSSKVLLDAEDNDELKARITELIESDADNRVSDIRVWTLGGEARAAVVSLVTHKPRTANHYKALVGHLPGLHHLNIEVHLCDGSPCDIHTTPAA